MIYLLIIAASYGVYEIQDGPKVCNCSNSQDMKIVAEKAIIHLKSETSKKCLANVNFHLKITHEDIGKSLEEYDTITLISSLKGKISEQIVSRTSRVQIHESLILKRKEALWIEVKSKGDLVSVTPIR